MDCFFVNYLFLNPIDQTCDYFLFVRRPNNTISSFKKPVNECVLKPLCFLAKPLPRSTKRAQLDVSIYSTDNEELNDDEIGLLSPGSAAQSEEIAKMYQAPRQQTYNLSDFVTERQEPVIVRTQRTSRHVPLDSFVQVIFLDAYQIWLRKETGFWTVQINNVISFDD